MLARVKMVITIEGWLSNFGFMGSQNMAQGPPGPPGPSGTDYLVFLVADHLGHILVKNCSI